MSSRYPASGDKGRGGGPAGRTDKRKNGNESVREMDLTDLGTIHKAMQQVLEDDQPQTGPQPEENARRPDKKPRRAAKKAEDAPTARDAVPPSARTGKEEK